MTTPSTAKNFIETIGQAIASSKLKEADDLCSEGMRCYPDNLRLKIQHGVILRRSGELAAAHDHFLGLVESYPGVAELEFKLADIALANNEIDEAERRIETASAKGGPRRLALILRADLARKRRDNEGECALLESVLEEADTLHLGIAVRLANVYSQLRAYEKAQELLQRVLAVDSNNINAHAALAGVAERTGDGLLAERMLLTLIERNPDKPNWYARALGLYLHLGLPDKAEEILRAGLSRGLAGAVLFSQVSALPTIPDLAEKVLEWARSVDDGATETERVVAEGLLFHYAPSSFVVKPDAGVSIEDRQPTLSDWLALSPADNDLKRPVVLESLGAEIQISRSSTSGKLVLVFLGLANRAMLPIGVFDRFFAALDCSVLYIRDNRRLLGNSGIGSVGETFADTVRYLHNTIAELGGERCIAVGSSAGGYPALRYGLEVGAEKILCFSGPTNITSEFLANDGRGAIVSRRLQTLPREAMDMRPHVINAKGRAEIHLIYGAAHQQDTMHALHLQGCPGVHLHPQEGVEEHGSILVLAKQRRLLPMLNHLIGTRE